MTVFYKIPLIAGTPQSLNITLGVKEYRLILRYRDVEARGLWTLDIIDVVSNAAIVCGIALVLGTDLLHQYRHLNIAGSLIVHSDGNADAGLSFESLGATSHLYFVV